MPAAPSPPERDAPPRSAPVLGIGGAPAAHQRPPPRARAPDLDGARDYDAIFQIVRASVRRVLGRERAGLGLALSDLPASLGAYWQVTGNIIVLNESLVRAMDRRAGSPRERNAFVYVVLLHEYLHALGFLSEESVRPVTARVARETFGPEHPASRMAAGDLWRMYPFLADVPSGTGRWMRMVSGFDSASVASYIR
ncbi:MAG: hypothetical protein QXG65_01305 [Thermoplasmata archaeon]